ncbi:hypothetical protein FRC02_011627 [Tulasnella sp. 418]|nr:hypothetical protein FRC02_011627 [Tulasnella sp. 418]
MTETTVSLPNHLHASLLALVKSDILPEEINSKLTHHVKPTHDASSSEIPYHLLCDISKWTQSDAGKEALLTKEIDYRDYSMIALLAGTTTSPSAKLGPFKRALSPESAALQRLKDRKAISALINGVLSVVGVGVAAWWAAGSVGWKPEYKALLAVFAAFAVAATEATLYWIWQWRYDTALKKHSHRKIDPPEMSDEKKSEEVIPQPSAAEAPIDDQEIRHRGRRRRSRDVSDHDDKD